MSIRKFVWESEKIKKFKNNDICDGEALGAKLLTATDIDKRLKRLCLRLLRVSTQDAYTFYINSLIIDGYETDKATR